MVIQRMANDHMVSRVALPRALIQRCGQHAKDLLTCENGNLLH